MFNRQANDLKDYTKALSKINISDDMIDTDKLKKEIERFNNYTIPEIRNQIIKTQEKDNEQFKRKHRILKDPFPIGAKVMIKNIENKRRKTDAKYEGPFYVQGYTTNGSYILTDRTGSILSRNLPTSQIKLIANETNKSDENKDIYEVQAVINHREVEPNGIEYLTTWVGYPDEQTWQKPEDFDSPETIKEYWKRRNANMPTKLGQVKRIKGSRKRKTPFKESDMNKKSRSN